MDHVVHGARTPSHARREALGEADGENALSIGSPRGRWLIAIGCAALCTAFLAFFTPLPQVADEHLALPIARAAADSTLYPASDLIISSGLRGPFHLYRLAGQLYARGVDVDAAWLGLLIASLVAAFACAWALAFSISRSPWVASVATATLAGANAYRGSIHWFLFPPPNLVTSTIATPLTLGALALAISGRWGPGLVLAALTFNVHPSMGLITAGTIALAMVAVSDLPRKQIAGWWAAAIACALPNVLFVAFGSPANFAAAPGDSVLSFAEQFRIYAHHAFIADHWRENYGWFVMQLGGIALLSRLLPAESRRPVGVTLAILCAVIVLWFLNLYTINYPALTLTFAARAAALVKPIAFAAVATCVAAWIRAAPPGRRAIRICAGAMLLVAALHKNLDIGEGMAAMAWGVIAWVEHRRAALIPAALLGGIGAVQVLGQGWGILGIAPFSPERTDMVRMAMIGAAAVFLAAAFAWRNALREESPTSAVRSGGFAISTLVCAAVLLFTIVLRGNPARMRPRALSDITRAARLAEPDTAVADIIRWAPRGTLPGSLFAVPPTDGRFGTFRLAAGRGIFGMAYDVDQLAYDAAQYGNAHARLLAQGMIVRGRHDLDGSAWDTLSAPRIDSLARLGVGYAVFNAAPRRAKPLQFPIVYEDPRWIVYDVRSAR
jgi:hypothetical protein